MDDAEPFRIGTDDFALPDYTESKEEVAEQVAFLAGPNARRTTGQEIGVDGGATWY